MTFHLTLRHENLLQLIMGAKDLKDEKIKLCLRLIDDEVLNTVDRPPLFDKAWHSFCCLDV